MSAGLFTLLGVNLALIAALPRFFFQGGELNLRWWLTAAPFITAGGLLILGMTGFIEPYVAADAELRVFLDVGATLMSAVSIALIAMTCGVHRRAPALWHQDADDQGDIVTDGPYARIRHPFYTAFLVGLGALAVALPHPATVFVLIYALVALNVTAAREERRLSASVHGERYRAYITRTHRFAPRLRSVR